LEKELGLMKNIVHWCKPKQKWTSHTYKSCAKASVVLITGGWKTEIKPNRKQNPRGWVYTEHNNVVLNPDPSLLEGYKRKDKLIYDKYSMEFNINEGEAILFDTDGCYILEEVS
jgi:hypothetical protein